MDSESSFLDMYRDATSLCQDHLFINQTIMNVGCVSVHFRGVASPLGNMKDFIFSQILSESVDWIKYLAKNPGRESGLTAYLATGISKQRYITLQHSFLKDDVTPAQLLNHYRTKKPFLCIVTFDRAEIPSEEARISEEENPLVIPEPKAEVRRKRRRSMMQAAVAIVRRDCDSDQVSRRYILSNTAARKENKTINTGDSRPYKGRVRRTAFGSLSIARVSSP